MLVRGLMAVTLSSAAYLVEGVICAPFPLPQLCSPLVDSGPRVSPPPLSRGARSVCQFSLVVLFSRSILSHTCRSFVVVGLGGGVVGRLFVNCWQHVDPCFRLLSSSRVGWENGSRTPLGAQAVEPHVSFCCFGTNLLSSSSVAGCAGCGEWGCGWAPSPSW
jgi:hypothetical protein